MFRYALVITVLLLTGCAGNNTKPVAVTPVKFCAGAKDVDVVARTLHLSAKGQQHLAEAESVLWPSSATGCNTNPLPDTWTVEIALPMIAAAVELATAQTEK